MHWILGNISEMKQITFSVMIILDLNNIKSCFFWALVIWISTELAKCFDIDSDYITTERNTCCKIHIVLLSNGNGLVNWQTYSSPCWLRKFLGCCLVWRVACTKPLSVINIATGTREVSHAGSFICITGAQLLIIFELNMLTRHSCVQQCTNTLLSEVCSYHQQGVADKYLTFSIPFS
jgi:hypothetical protein